MASNYTPFYLTGMGKRFYESQVPQLIKGINRVADNLEKMNNSDNEIKSGLSEFVDSVHYKDLLTELIEYLCVAEKPKYVIEILYKHGFEKSDLLEFSFSEEDIDEVIEEVDNECDEE